MAGRDSSAPNPRSRFAERKRRIGNIAKSVETASRRLRLGTYKNIGQAAYALASERYPKYSYEHDALRLALIRALKDA